MPKLEMRKRAHKYRATLQRDNSNFVLDLEIEVSNDYIRIKGEDDLSTEVDVVMNADFLETFIELLRRLQNEHKAFVSSVSR